jgi:ubiquinone/menaquinone biosynthesis C-methylase UbiE
VKPTESQDYDRLADEYAKHRRAHPDVVDELVTRGRLGPSSRVLEVGCGTGNYLAAVHAVAGCTPTGLDPSEGMLTSARGRAAAAKLVRGRAESLPFEDASFDLVYSVDVIHHVGDRARYYREARRVLDTNGLLCTVTESEDMIRRREPHATYFPEAVEVELARYPRIDDLRRMMEDAGFASIETSNVELVDRMTDARMYADKACSSLHLITEDAFRRGMRRLEADLAKGPLPRPWRYALLWTAR